MPSGSGVRAIYSTDSAFARFWGGSVKAWAPQALEAAQLMDRSIYQYVYWRAEWPCGRAGHLLNWLGLRRASGRRQREGVGLLEQWRQRRAEWPVGVGHLLDRQCSPRFWETAA